MNAIIQSILAKAYVAMKLAHESQKNQLARETFDLHPSFRFNGPEETCYGPGRIVGGEGAYVGSGSAIQAGEGTTVTLGKGCRIGHLVRIHTHTNPSYYYPADRARWDVKAGDVVIGDGAWIGHGVYICPGVTIGEMAIVGANSVVTKDVPPLAIVGGVPARLIRQREAVGPHPE